MKSVVEVSTRFAAVFGAGHGHRTLFPNRDVRTVEVERTEIRRAQQADIDQAHRGKDSGSSYCQFIVACVRQPDEAVSRQERSGQRDVDRRVRGVFDVASHRSQREIRRRVGRRSP